MNRLWLLLVVPFDRLIGMGILPRLISVPVACTVIGFAVARSAGVRWRWFALFGGLFFAARVPACFWQVSLAHFGGLIWPTLSD